MTQTYIEDHLVWKWEDKAYPDSLCCSVDKSTGETNWSVFERTGNNAAASYNTLIGSGVMLWSSANATSNSRQADTEVRNSLGTVTRVATTEFDENTPAGFWFPIGVITGYAVTWDGNTGIELVQEDGTKTSTDGLTPHEIQNDRICERSLSVQGTGYTVNWSVLTSSGTTNSYSETAVANGDAVAVVSYLDSVIVLVSNNTSGDIELTRISNGSVDWTTTLSATTHLGSLQVSGSTVYYVEQNLGTSVAMGSINVGTGAVNWETTVTVPSGSTVQHIRVGDVVTFLLNDSGSYSLKAFATATGASAFTITGQRWVQHMFSGVMLTADAFQNGDIYAYSTSTGSLLWSMDHFTLPTPPAGSEANDANPMIYNQASKLSGDLILSFPGVFHRPATGSGIPVEVPGWNPSLQFGVSP